VIKIEFESRNAIALFTALRTKGGSRLLSLITQIGESQWAMAIAFGLYRAVKAYICVLTPGPVPAQPEIITAHTL